MVLQQTEMRSIFLLYLDNMIYNLNNMKVKEKKTPWYKKFWNKITHKNWYYIGYVVLLIHVVDQRINSPCIFRDTVVDYDQLKPYW